jgi:hypothetical protein
MSQGGIANLAQTGGGGLIQTINGDTGSITGNTVTIFANNAANNSGASVFFTNSGTVSTLNLTDSLYNTYLGINVGVVGRGTENVGVGQNVMYNLSPNGPGVAATNVGIGFNSLPALGYGHDNVGLGADSLLRVVDGNGNIGIGRQGGYGIAGSASYNVCIGIASSHPGPCTGSYNVIIGPYTAGKFYSGSESSNILLSHFGVNAENNAIHIGTQGSGAGQQNTCYIAGIVGVTNSNAQLVTINSSTGQLGVVSGSPVVGTWSDVTGATQTLAVGNGYATDRAGGVTYTLPATATFGDLIKIVGKSGIATITPNANQQIVIGSINGTVGVTGTAVAQIAGSCIALRCITGGSSSVWRAEEYPGGWNLT